jgi:hypothetical protein
MRNSSSTWPCEQTGRSPLLSPLTERAYTYNFVKGRRTRKEKWVRGENILSAVPLPTSFQRDNWPRSSETFTSYPQPSLLRGAELL